MAMYLDKHFKIYFFPPKFFKAKIITFSDVGFSHLYLKHMTAIT